MPSLDDDTQDPDSSTRSDLDAQQQVSAETQADGAVSAETAKSSDATGDTDQDLLGVVRDVVSKSRAESASPAEGEEETEQKTEKTDDENYSDVPFHKHPRFQQLLRKSKTYEQDAIRYNNVVGFLESNHLSSEEAADGLAIMGLAKTNPAEAWKRIKPWVQKVLVAAGEVLPDDLETRVNQGELSREAALELSRARAGTASLQAANSFREESEKARQVRAEQESVVQAVTSWETERRQRDPNFDAKYEAIQKEIAWMIAREGQPQTPAGVKDMCAKAYAAVNKSYRPPSPSPKSRPIRPVTGGQVAGKQAPEPRSTLDIVRAHRRTA